MSKHTPGPWTFRSTGPHWNNPEIQNWVVCWSPDGERVVDHVYEEADAKLIAAAPDLLEALENLENDDCSIPAHAWEMVLAAIDKAT